MLKTISIFNCIHSANIVTNGPRSTSKAYIVQKFSIALLAPTSWLAALTPSHRNACFNRISRTHIVTIGISLLAIACKAPCSQPHVKHVSVSSAIALKWAWISCGWVYSQSRELLFLLADCCFYAIEFTRNAMNSHLRSQVRLSCDGKFNRNRANSNFHTQSAIVILAPIIMTSAPSRSCWTKPSTLPRTLGMVSHGSSLSFANDEHWFQAGMGQDPSTSSCSLVQPQPMQMTLIQGPGWPGNGRLLKLNSLFHWSQRTLLVSRDHAAVVSIMATSTCCDHHFMAPMRDSPFQWLLTNFLTFAQHIWGVNNDIADSPACRSTGFTADHSQQLRR